MDLEVIVIVQEKVDLVVLMVVHRMVLEEIMVVVQEDQVQVELVRLVLVVL